MISVRSSADTVLVMERGMSSLVVSGALFALLGGLTLLEPATTTQHHVSTGLLFATAIACAVAGLRFRYLCRFRRPPASSVTGQVTVRWNTRIDSRLSVHGDDDDSELFGGNRVSQVLTAAAELATALGMPLVVISPPGSPRRETPEPERAQLDLVLGGYRLPPSGAHRRAALACRVVGVLLAVQMAYLTVHTLPRVGELHPLSLILAVAMPASVLLIALALGSRQPLVRLAEALHVEYTFLGRCWHRSTLDPAQTRCTLLQHPRLDLGFVWLHTPRDSIVLSSSARAAAALTAQLSKHQFHNSPKGSS